MKRELPIAALRSACEYKELFDLSRISTMRVGGLARYFFKPVSKEELCRLLDILDEVGYPYKLIGGASNTLFCDDVYEGAVISTRGLGSISREGSSFLCEAGVSLASLLSYAAGCGYGGAEQLWHIPGTLGGAVAGNAGAHGLEVFDVLEGVYIRRGLDGRCVELSPELLEPSYRTTKIKCGADITVLGATVGLDFSNAEDILRQKRKFAQMRAKTQPIGEPSLGSVFKRSDGVSAAFYIDKLGLKGYRVGGAAISDKHAGFIVAERGASPKDVLRLIAIIKEKVHDAFGIGLECEIDIVGGADVLFDRTEK
ncbi:MAG: UDP-N-acetylmuramate dehydrogenase [Clostridia bacterium]|nr:UDP-N-acetylmuramate dehydrogenase [Clostridia bacterium]